MDLIEKINDIDFEKVQKKTIKIVVGFLFGSFFLVMANKFVDDNFSFRIRRISNLPEPETKEKELGITHYFDDQQTILDKLVNVDNKFLFDSVDVFKNSGYARVKSWKEIAKLI